MKYYIEQLRHGYNIYTKKNVYIVKKGTTFLFQSHTMVRYILFLKRIKVEPNKRIEIPEDIFNLIKSQFFFWGND